MSFLVRVLVSLEWFYFFLMVKNTTIAFYCFQWWSLWLQSCLWILIPVDLWHLSHIKLLCKRGCLFVSLSICMYVCMYIHVLCKSVYKVSMHTCVCMWVCMDSNVWCKYIHTCYTFWMSFCLSEKEWPSYLFRLILG